MPYLLFIKSFTFKEMKKYLFLYAIFSFIFLAPTSAEASGHYINELKKLNKYWSNAIHLAKRLQIPENTSENELISIHLKAVIDSLDRVEVDHLTKRQFVKRKALLKALAAYASSGIFPINTNHAKRTPYFIDDFGTACAVGHLIIESGHRSLAEKISSEMNYAYLEDMNYPEIQEWATVHGFSLAELKWIQPGYGPQCPIDSAVPPTCPNGFGCIHPDYYKTNLDSASLKLDVMERNTGNGWLPDSNLYIYWSQGYWPYGIYRFCLSDSLNNRDTIYYDIMGPTPFVLKDSVIRASNNCLNTIQLSAQNGRPPYRFRLYKMPSYTQMSSNGSIFDSLCPGNYLAELTDSNFCFYNKQITVSGISSLIEVKTNDQWLVQNPVLNNMLHVRTKLKGMKHIKLFSLSGQLMDEAQFGTEELKRNVELKNGIYVLQLSNETVSFNKKIVISD